MFTPFKNDKPTRFRRYSNFNLDVVDCDTLVFNQINQNMFNQDVDDFRNKTRAFTTMEKTVINDTFYQLMGQIVGLTLFSNPSIKKMNISVHQVRLLSYPNLTSDNAPEGIHKDGADYIVSALIMNKNKIKNGKSIIYDSSKNLLDEYQLELGEFIYQEDRNLWHDITPIKAENNFYGYRDILGFDFKIIK